MTLISALLFSQFFVRGGYRLSGRSRSPALGLYGVYRRRHQHDRLRARARVARLRGRDVFRSEKVRASQSLEPFGSSQSPRARPAPHESLDVFAAPSARDRERWFRARAKNSKNSPSSNAARRVPFSSSPSAVAPVFDGRLLSSPCHAPTHSTSYLRARACARRSTGAHVALLTGRRRQTAPAGSIS